MNFYQLLRDIQKAIPIDPLRIDYNNDGKLVLLQGELLPSKGCLHDSHIPSVEYKTVLKMVRSTETYQWKQQKIIVLFGINIYYYTPVWEKGRISSEKFVVPNYINPTPKLQSETQTASPIRLGAYELSEDVASNIPLDHHQTDQTQVFYYNVEEITDRDKVAERLCSNHLSDTEKQSLEKNVPTMVVPCLKEEPGGPPKIGDTRVHYQLVRPGFASVLAKQQDNKLVPFFISEDKQVSMVVWGKQSALRLLLNNFLKSIH